MSANRQSNPRSSVDYPAALLTGLAAATGLIGVWALFYGLGRAPFPPFDLADRIIEYSPGNLSTSAIENTGSWAQRLLLAGGMAVYLCAGASLGVVLRPQNSALRGALYALVGLPLVMWSVNAAGESTSTLGWIWRMVFFGTTLALAGGLTGHWLAQIAQGNDQQAAQRSQHWLDQPGDASRRDVLRQALGFGLLVGGGGLFSGWLLDWFGVNDEPTLAGTPLNEVRSILLERAVAAGETVDLSLPESIGPLSDTFPAPPGVRPRNTSNELFYTVDISTRDPNLPEDDWTLRIRGEVEREVEISYQQLLSMPSIKLDGTLMCISYEFQSRLISTTQWTGVPLRNVLELAGLRDQAVDLICRGAGGYTDSIPLGKGLEETTILAYGMNGDALPRSHGFPCRLYVPNNYGIKNVKWLREIEVADHDYRGFWQERGWTETGIVNVISVIDTPTGDATPDAAGTVPTGGIAFAGSRGIARVEVQIDGGFWQAAELEPYLPRLVWQRWRYDWPSAPGEHRIRVRAVDLRGTLQDETNRDPHPDGLTGYHEVTIQVL